MLPADLQSILDNVAMLIEQDKKRNRESLISGTAARTGLGSPQIAEIENKADIAGTTQIANLLNQLLMQTYGEKRQDELTEEEWERKLGFQRMTANQQMDYLQTQLSASALENEKQREWATAERIAQQEWQEDLAKDASKSVASSAWTKLLTSAGLGALTGGVGTVAGLLDGNAIGNTLTGLLSGSGTMGNILGKSIENKNMMNWLKKYSSYGNDSPFATGKLSLF